MATLAILKGLNPTPTDVFEALHVLDTVSARLRAEGDRRAAFPDIYGMITHAIADEVRGKTGFFQEEEWISREAGRFCERYLDTLRWSLAGTPQDCRAWGITYELAAARATAPVQDVVLGLSSHINYDLAQGVAATILEFGRTDEAAMRRYKHDHDAVNTILQNAMGPCFERIATRYRCRFAPLMDKPAARPHTYPLFLKVLSIWRATVWKDVEALVRAPGGERFRVLATMEERSARINTVLTVGSRAYLGAKPFVPTPVLRRWKALFIDRSRPSPAAQARQGLEAA